MPCVASELVTARTPGTRQCYHSHRCPMARPARMVLARAATVADRHSGLRSLDDLPVQKGLPVLGMAMTVLGGDFHPRTYFEKHGTDAFMMDFGIVGGLKLTIKDPNRIRDVLTRNSVFTPDAPESSTRLLFPDGTNISDDVAKPWRAAILKVMAPENVMRLQLPMIISGFEERIRESAQSGHETLWREDARRVAMDIACRALLGDILTKEDVEYIYPKFMDMFDGAFSMDFGFERGLPFTAYRRGSDGRQAMLELVSRKVEAVLQDREALDEQDIILSKLLKALEEEGLDTTSQKGSQVAEKLAREVLFLMAAGTETTSYQISRSLQYLSLHPQWLKALNDEQDRLAEEFGAGPMDRKIISRSAVAMALAQEVLRLSPTVKMLYRKATEDTMVGDIIVPEGTSCALAISPSINKTGTGGSHFDPAQWLNEDWTQCSTNRGSLAFGTGPRRCVGQTLAMMEVTSCLAIFGREVSAIQMSDEEANRKWGAFHPTGMPARFVPR